MTRHAFFAGCLMRILITNDDGLFFPGLTILHEELSEIAEVYVAAPARERSGTSNAITIYDNIYVHQENDQTLMVEGFPADCVNIALYGGFFHKPFDLVVSGINKGVNMGADVFYSGTVGAARHAFVHGISGIAISSGHLAADGDFHSVARFMKEFIPGLHASLNQPYLVNINYPDHDEIHGIKWTKLGTRKYRDSYTRDNRGENAWFLNLGGSFLGYEEEEGTDFEAFYSHWISVTPLTIDATDYKTLANMATEH